jgi:hypothetical protein
MEEITHAEYDHRVRANKSSSTPMFDLTKVKIKGEEIPQFWILAWDARGELEETEGYWTEADRQRRAIDLLEANWTVTYSTAALQADRRIQDVLRYWRDMRQNAEQDLREHAEANPTGCPVGCEQCANLLRQYDATLSPSERAEGERKTAEAKALAKKQAEDAGIEALRRKMNDTAAREARFRELQAEWIDALQLIDNPSWSDDERQERHGRWLYNLSDDDKNIWDEFVPQD